MWKIVGTNRGNTRLLSVLCFAMEEGREGELPPNPVGLHRRTADEQNWQKILALSIVTREVATYFTIPVIPIDHAPSLSGRDIKPVRRKRGGS
jgi:hypothetical protein